MFHGRKKNREKKIKNPGNDIILKSKMCSAVFAAIEVSFKIDQEKPSHVSLYTNLSTWNPTKQSSQILHKTTKQEELKKKTNNKLKNYQPRKEN